MEVKRKWWVLDSAYLFPARKREAVIQGGNQRGIDYPTWRITREAVRGVVKGWEDKNNKNNTSAGPLSLNN